MDYRSNHTDKPDISHYFPRRERAGGAPFSYNLCSQTLAARQFKKKLTVRNWLIECYSGFAGDIYFLKPGAGRKERREKNSIHLYAPGCSFREDTRNADIPLRETFIYFTNGEVFGLDKLTGGKSRFCRFFDPEQKVIRLMLEAAAAAALKGDSAFWKVQSLLIGCADYLINSSVKTGEDSYEIKEKEISPEESLVIKAEDFMRKHISSNIKNADIAGFLNMSESSFNHKFREAAGIPPNARQLEMKIDAAKNLLLKGARLKNIAEAAGFKDEFYLSRIFKKVTGVSPKNFKKENG